MRIVPIIGISVLALSLCAAEAAQTIVMERPADIVDLATVAPDIRVDMMYASRDNFIGAPVDGYKANICYVTRAAAEGLKSAQQRLQEVGQQRGKMLTLLVRDCYRPVKAVRQFVKWAADPADTRMKAEFYPDLAKQQLIEQNYISPVSGHSRASSIDLTIAERQADGSFTQLPMGTRLDFFGPRSHTAAPDISAEEKKNRALLGAVMVPEFKNYAKEWWHYVLKTEPYPTTFFDFDVAASDRVRQGASSPDRSPAERPYSSETAAAEKTALVTTLISEAPLLAELDHDNTSPLSLMTLFRTIHASNKLAIPTTAPAGPARAGDLVRFSESYGQFASVMSADIARVITELDIDWEKEILKTYDPKSAKTDAGKVLRLNGNVTRVFNEKWLGSPDGLFILAGVVNRIDRRDFDPRGCGELRLIYRLGYDVEMNGKVFASRMPFTVNMVYSYNDDGHHCADAASLWRIAGMGRDTPPVLAQRLLHGPLDFNRLTFKQMEINAQIARFPSDLENAENRKFAGQAIYWMRIFALKDGRFRPIGLENTPDVQAIQNNPAKQRQLREYIAQHLGEIDNGTFILPDALTADIALSFSTAGSSRLANRPFDLVVGKNEAEQIVATSGVAANPGKFVRSGAALLERLNTSSCMGCHQSSSTAGFHFLGVDRFDFGSDVAAIHEAFEGNTLQLPYSPHVDAELKRRSSYLTHLAAGQPPNTFRPHPSAPAADWEPAAPIYAGAGDNMPCPLADDVAGAARWSCDASRGLSCRAVMSNAATAFHLGQCVPAAQNIHAGLTCRADTIDDSLPKAGTAPLLSFNLRAFNDRVGKEDLIYALPEGKLSGPDYNCRPTRIGVPLGRITRPCTADEAKLSAIQPGKIPDEICAIVGGKGFEQMAKGYFDSAAFAAGVGRGLLNVCSPSRFCREDYICQEMPDFLTGEKFNVAPQTLATLKSEKLGFCTPTYFVYQLRLDGHPNPR